MISAFCFSILCIKLFLFYFLSLFFNQPFLNFNLLPDDRNTIAFPGESKNRFQPE
jgi:hypothetical protein